MAQLFGRSLPSLVDGVDAKMIERRLLEGW